MNLFSVEASESRNPEAIPAPGGFAQAVDLLEFDRVRQFLAGHTSTVMGGEAAQGLTPSADLLEVATRLQETSEACRFLSGGGGLEFGPGTDFREFVRRALLGGLLNGQELHAVSNLAAAARYAEAVADFDKALSMDSTLDVIYSLRGEAQHKREQYTEALADYDQSL